MLNAERLQERQAGLGGSDIAAALGMSNWKTPLELYLEKTGQIIPPDISANDNVHFGIVLEDAVAEEFSRRTGLKVRRNNQHLIHPEYDFLAANIDRAVVGKPFGLKCGLECKTADKWAARFGWGDGATFDRDEDGNLVLVSEDDEVPTPYLLQCAHYMAITDSPLWFLAVLIGGNDFRIYTIRRNQQLEKIMLQRAAKFWTQNVLAEKEPAPITLLDLETLYAKDNGESVEATDEIIKAWADIKELQAQKSAIETRLEGQTIGSTKVGGLKNQLRAHFGEHSEVIVGSEGKTLATWKKSKDRKVFDAEAFKAAHPKLHREFLVEKPGSRFLYIK